MKTTLSDEFEEPSENGDHPSGKHDGLGRMIMLPMVAGLITLVVLLYLAY